MIIVLIASQKTFTTFVRVKKYRVILPSFPVQHRALLDTKICKSWHKFLCAKSMFYRGKSWPSIDPIQLWNCGHLSRVSSYSLSGQSHESVPLLQMSFRPLVFYLCFWPISNEFVGPLLHIPQTPQSSSQKLKKHYFQILWRIAKDAWEGSIYIAKCQGKDTKLPWPLLTSWLQSTSCAQ